MTGPADDRTAALLRQARAAPRASATLDGSAARLLSRSEVRATINGEEQELPDGLTVLELLRHLGVGPGRVAVERNGAVVKRAQHQVEPVEGGDVIEVVSFVGGG